MALVVVAHCRLEAVHLVCDACQATAIFPASEILSGSMTRVRAWFGSHYAPRLADIEVSTTTSAGGNRNTAL